MTSPVQTLSGLNSLPASSFVAALGEVFEFAPWVAEAALTGRPYPTITALHDAMMQAVRQAAPNGSWPSSAATPNLAVGSNGPT